MITASLIIIAWTAGLPLWASILVTVFASAHFIWTGLKTLIRLAE